MHLTNISEWTKKQFMQINGQKTKYMIFNKCDSKQFQTRLYINDSLLQQVHKTRLLGLIISDDLTWHSNTKSLFSKNHIYLYNVLEGMSLLKYIYC